jgi:hypothetical protein
MHYLMSALELSSARMRALELILRVKLFLWPRSARTSSIYLLAVSAESLHT